MDTHLRLCIVISFVALSLVSCGGGSVDPATTAGLDKFRVQSQVEQNAFEKTAREFPARNNAVAIPKHAPWLGEARTSHFKQGNAKTLIMALAAPHPVRFDVADDPVVFAPANAVILKDYFDSIAIQSNWTYTVSAGVLIFSDWEVKSIFLAALVGKTSAVLKTKSGAGVSTQENQLTTATDPYSEIELLVAEILNVRTNNPPITRQPPVYSTPQPFTETTVDGVIVPTFETISQESVPPLIAESPLAERIATFSVSRSANMLSIAAKPNQVREVVAVIDQYNNSVSKRAIIDVTVYDVALTGGDNRSINLNLLKVATNTLISTGSSDALTISRASSAAVQARNQTIIFNWIESQGTVSKRIHRRFETLNNHAVTFLDTEEIEYVKKVALARQSDGATSTVTPEVEIGAHQIGREFNLLATILAGRVNIQMTINDRRISSRERYSLGGAGEGTLLNILNTDKVIPLSLRDGETRVLTYFQQDNTETNHTKNRFLPGVFNGKQDSAERSETVIVISAEIVGGV